ncbi:hypothetical protein [Numidum massiliense]|uniref:hypothetical protein n=1 Tax=Numidum massiliense TaxID=1522315 RepID=UPI0006D5A2F0|nr:hypothetical protein [Numidum massiliense]
MGKPEGEATEEARPQPTRLFSAYERTVTFSAGVARTTVILYDIDADKVHSRTTRLAVRSRKSTTARRIAFNRLRKWAKENGEVPAVLNGDDIDATGIPRDLKPTDELRAKLEAEADEEARGEAANDGEA